MAAKISGNRAINFKGGFDISEIIANQEKVIKGFNDVKTSAERSVVNSGSSNNLRQQNLATQQALRDSRLETERLKREQIELERQIAETGVATADLTRRFQQNRLAQQELTIANRLARQSQTAATGSYREAQERLKALGKEIREATGGFANLGAEQRRRIAEYRTLNDRLTEFDRRLGNNQRNVGNYRTAISGLGNSLLSLTAGYISAYGALAGFTSIVRNNSQISDSLADVRRTAELTEAEANNLLDTLKKFNTRTSLKGLLDIAGIGGQIGIAKDQLIGFTRSIDQLAVVLASEIPGGANAVATALGKINGVFDTQRREGTSVEESFNRTGSAILKLGQSGLATGDFLTDFTQRVSGSAKQANIALPVILAYGSVLEEAGKSAEVAGSSLNKIIAGLSVNRGKYFAIAKLADSTLTLEKFSKVINTDTNAALQLFFKGLNSGNPTQTAFADRLATIPRLAGETRSSIIALAQAQTKLEEKIKDSSSAYSDASIISDQIKIKNEALAGSIDRLRNSIINLSTDPNSSLGKYFGSFLDSLAGGIKGIDIGIGRLRDLQYDSAIQRFDRNGQTGNIFIGVDDVKAEKERRRLQKIQENTNEAVKIGGQLFKNATVDIQVYNNSVERLAEEEEKLNKIRSDIKVANDAKKNTDALQRQLIIQRTLVNKLKEAYRKDNSQTNISGVGTGDEKEQRRQQQALDRARALGNDLAKNRAESLKNQQEYDQSEVQSVKNAYDERRRIINDFFESSKNQNQPIVIDGKNFSRSKALAYVKADENRDLELAQAKQTIELDKQTYDQQKVIFKEYEDYRLEVGEKTARERFKGDIGAYDDYISYLKGQLPKETDISVEANKRRDLINKQLLPKAQKDQLKQQQDVYTRLLADTLSFQERRSNIILRGEENVALLRKKSQEAQALQLQQNNKRELEIFDEGYKETIPALRRLYQGVDDLSRQSALSVINSARQQLEALLLNKEISTDVYNEILKLINQSEVSVKNRWIDGLSSVASEITNIGSLVDDVDSGFSKLLGTLGSVLGQVSNIGKGIESFKKAQKDGDILGGISSGLGIAGAGISIFKTIFSLFDRSKKREEQAAYAKELQNKQTEAVNKALERQVNLLDKVYGTDRIKNYDLAIKQAQQNEADYLSQLNGKFQLTGDKTLDKFIEELNNTGKISDFFGRAYEETIRKAGRKLPEDIASLQKLLDEGKLDANTGKIVENLIKANETAVQLANNLRTELTGTSIDQLADDFISTLTDGTQNFGDTFEKTIQKAIIQGFKGDLIKAQLQAFYEDFAKLSKDGLTEAEINVLRDSYLKAADDQKKKLEDLQKITGIDLTSGNKTPSGITGEIQRTITENTASILSGLARAQFEVLVKINTEQTKTSTVISNFAQANLASMQRLENYTSLTSRNTNRLENIEAYLFKISSKTIQTERDLGI